MGVQACVGTCDEGVETLHRHPHMLLDHPRPRSHLITRAHTTHPIRAPPSVGVVAGGAGAGVGMQARVGTCDEDVGTLRRQPHMLLNHP